MSIRDRTPAIQAAKSYVELSKEKGSAEDVANAFISLGYCHFWFDELAEAIESTEEALRMLLQTATKTTHICKANLAYYLAASGKDKERALRLADEAVEGLGNEPLSTDTRGYVRMRFAETLEQLMLARDDFLAACQLDPGLNAAYKHLAEVDASIKLAKEKGRL
jgi:tetratricopeptide (TPR) repeat protein